MTEKLKNKFLLIDTCVISSMFDFDDEFGPFLKSLTELNCHPCINEFIYLEFIRIARDKNTKQEIEKLLNNFTCLPATDKLLYQIAREIYPLYNHCGSIKNQKQVSVVDLLNVAYLKKHNGSLLYITFDNNDFPLEILNRVETGTIDVKKQILTWGLYQFDTAGHKKLLQYYK